MDADLNPIYPQSLEHGGERIAAAVVRPQSETSAEPVFVWLPGYGSHMDSFKASWLTKQCQTWSLPLVKFDYRGTGQSGGVFTDFVLGDWIDDTLAVIEGLTHGPVILVGSSLGAWIGLNVAQRCQRVQAMAIVSGAADFTRRFWEACSPAEQEAWRSTGERILGHNGLVLTHRFVEEAKDNLVLETPIPFDGPVSILHGMKDDVVDYKVAEQTLARLTTTDVTLHLIKDGDHGLGRPDDLTLLWQELTRLHERVSSASAPFAAV